MREPSLDGATLRSSDAMSTIMISTWNLDRPARRQSVRGQAIRSAIEAVSADILVLTEARTSLTPAPGYFSAHSQPHPERRDDPDERWASVWSRWPATVVWQDVWSVTALISLPHGELVVHGVVLPYINEPGPAGLHAPGWSRFMEEILHQQDQWTRIRAQFPAVQLIVAGDLNQSLDGSSWYGSRQTREALLRAADAAGLKCLTGEDVVARGKLRRNHLVDHILATDGFVVREGIVCWEPTTTGGLRMSDHPGVAVRLAWAS